MRRAVLTGFVGAAVLMSCAGAPWTKGAPSVPTAESLIGTSWRLEDLSGSGALEGVEATLVFPKAEQVAGDGSCNRFAGSLTLSEGAVRIGPLVSTRRACPPPIMNQETRYLKALQAAHRLEMQGGDLVIYPRGAEKPLRLARQEAAEPEP